MPAVGKCVSDGDTAWVSISTILVLGMIPALGLFEAGLLRAKNTTSIISQVFGGTVVLALMWDLFGFSLTYGKTIGGLIGNPVSFPLLLNMKEDECFKFAPTIPKTAFATFQAMFACITPLLMTGAYAERVRWYGFLVFTVLWELLIYYPVAHWVWAEDGWLRKLGALDFAGGIVIHATAGSASFVVCWFLGPRKIGDHDHPSNMPVASLGAGLLWLGWFGFNAGSARAGPLSVSTIATTQAGAVACGTVWMFWSKSVHRRQRSSLRLEHILNGVIAGLAGITPAAGYIAPQWALAVGMLLGVTSLLGCYLLEYAQVDDALEVTAVHGIPGIVGALCVGIFASTAINPDGADGLLYNGGLRLLLVQFLAILVCSVYAAAVTLALAAALEKTIKFRVTAGEEELGLDNIEHDVKAYEWLPDEEKLELGDGEERARLLHGTDL